MSKFSPVVRKYSIPPEVILTKKDVADLVNKNYMKFNNHYRALSAVDTINTLNGLLTSPIEITHSFRSTSFDGSTCLEPGTHYKVNYTLTSTANCRKIEINKEEFARTCNGITSNNDYTYIFKYVLFCFYSFLKARNPNFAFLSEPLPNFDFCLEKFKSRPSQQEDVVLKVKNEELTKLIMRQETSKEDFKTLMQLVNKYDPRKLKHLLTNIENIQEKHLISDEDIEYSFDQKIIKDILT